MEDNNSDKRIEEVDISKKTIVVLVILTVMISLVSTFTVLHEISRVKVVPRQAVAPQTTDSAKVSLTILEGPKAPDFKTASGNAVLNIQKPKK